MIFRHPNGERKDYFILIFFFLAARDGALCTPDKAQKEVGVGVCVILTGQDWPKQVRLFPGAEFM